LLWTVGALVAGCQSSPPNETGIRLGMTKDELDAEIGAPVSIRERIESENGELVEVWLYRIDRVAETGGDVATGVLTSGMGFFDDPTNDFYLFRFIDGRLVSWEPDAEIPQQAPGLPSP
jgi:hypothetical protein